jgi:hypothetical protein
MLARERLELLNFQFWNLQRVLFSRDIEIDRYDGSNLKWKAV